MNKTDRLPDLTWIGKTAVARPLPLLEERELKRKNNEDDDNVLDFRRFADQYRTQHNKRYVRRRIKVWLFIVIVALLSVSLWVAIWYVGSYLAHFAATAFLAPLN